MGGHKRRMGRRGPNNKNRGARDAQAVDGQAGGDGYDFPKNNEDFERFYKVGNKCSHKIGCWWPCERVFA